VTRTAEADRRSSTAAPARTDLPDEVVALAARLGASPQSPTDCVQLTQVGTMRLAPDSADHSFTASQTLAVRHVGFAWRARLRLAGPVAVRITEGLDRGEGYLDARVFGVVRLARVRGGDLAFQGEAMRYLAELIWNPDAILFNPELEWRVLNQEALLIGLGTGARRVEIRVNLDRNGDPVSVAAAARPRLVGRNFEMTPWFGRCEGYEWQNGRRIPRRAEAGWDLGGRRFVCWRSHIETWSIT
jgi:hypothetical protein